MLLSDDLTDDQLRRRQDRRAFDQGDVGHPLNVVDGPRVRKPVVRFGEFGSDLKDASLASVVVGKEGNTSEEFRESRQKQLDALRDYGVYEDVDVGEAGNNHIFSVTWSHRRVMDGTYVSKRKSRVAQRGCESDMSRAETTSPTPTHDEIRFFYAHGIKEVKRKGGRRTVVVKRLINAQNDVGNAFLLADRDKPVYCYPPEGYTSNPRIIWRLKKALPGGRDAGRLWWTKEAVPFALAQGFVRLAAFQCTFVRECPETKMQEILQIATDNFNFWLSSEKRIAQFREAGQKAFNVFTIERTSKYLGIDIEERVNDGHREIKLYMKSHIAHLVADLGLAHKHPVAVPWVSSEEVPKTPSELEKLKPQSVMGMINFCGIARPDIAAAVSELASKQSKPTEFDFRGAEQVVRYLKGTAELGVVYNENGNDKADGDADADGAGSKEDRRTRLGCVSFLGDGPITWHTGKLKWTVPLSTCHGEIASISKQIQHLRTINNYVSSFPKSPFDRQGPFKLRNDNAAAFHCSNEFIFGKGLKHIKLRYAHVNNDVAIGFVQIEHVSSKNNRADIFTKPLKRDVFVRLRAFIVRA
eukprot:gb/GEZN01001045.1/.p1 GENE.gb/GEZN01001045.1/~~gb/GEZN01001045.1/.p1  ORF type:complete len:584 (-),score=42.62 gb/GEZN01001045.1/:469-2220(-)